MYYMFVLFLVLFFYLAFQAYDIVLVHLQVIKNFSLYTFFLFIHNLASLALCAPPHLVDYRNTPDKMIFEMEGFSTFLDQAYGKDAPNKPPKSLYPALMDYMNSNCKRNIRGNLINE